MGSFSLPKDVLEAEIDLIIATRPERDPYHLKNRSPVVRVLPVNPEDKETFESLMTYIGPRQATRWVRAKPPPVARVQMGGGRALSTG
jgi:hypothetical protein